MNQIELVERLNAHKRWVNEDPTGVRGDFTNEDLAGLDFSNKFLNGVILDGAYLAGCNFSSCLAPYASLVGANLTGATLTEGQFFHANFNAAILVDASLYEGAFDEASFMETVWGNNDLRGATFTVAKMSFPVYTFNILGEYGVATPTDLRIGQVTKTWQEWNDELLKARFTALGAPNKDMERHLLFISFFKKVLIERGYSL
jgi:uncharacterized protein YjbI with pentapeptide repeats